MAEIIQLPENQHEDHPLLGRLLMLNVEKTNKFTSKDFVVTSSNPVAFVGPDCFFDNLQHAIDQGILIDVTDNKVAASGLKTLNNKNKNIGKIRQKVESTAFISRTEDGQHVLIIPKNKKDENALKLELSVNGYIKPKGNPTGLSKITVTKVED